MIFDLRRMTTVMVALGNPEERFPAIHVAGTNGKGSVCALLASALQVSGRRTGLYTSPHLERLNERFRVDGQEASDRDIARLSHRITRALRSIPFRLTQFEFLTALAFAYFAEKKVDVAVVEVGLGGRLDATNILPHVAVSVITNIGLDHREWLGSTVEAIAGEKAGIVRPRVPVVTGADGRALGVIRRRAAALRAPLTVAALSGAPRTTLLGPHQRRNAAVALEAVKALRRLGWALPDADVRRGFAGAHWPGRFECFTLPAGENRIRWVLDGAHNVPAAIALRGAIREAKLGRVDLVFGALRDKDFSGIARQLAPIAARVTTVAVPSNRSADPRALARLPVWRTRATAARNLEAALAGVENRAPRIPVLVTGSLYLVGAARAWLSRKRSSQ